MTDNSQFLPLQSLRLHGGNLEEILLSEIKVRHRQIWGDSTSMRNVVTMRIASVGGIFVCNESHPLKKVLSEICFESVSHSVVSNSLRPHGL